MIPTPIPDPSADQQKEGPSSGDEGEGREDDDMAARIAQMVSF